jgi:hypothetical protein
LLTSPVEQEGMSRQPTDCQSMAQPGRLRRVSVPASPILHLQRPVTIWG